MMYEIKEILTKEEVSFLLKKVYREMEGLVYKHNNGNIYQIVDTSILNIDGKSLVSVCYCPLEEGRMVSDVRFVRPLNEFLDGRFEVIK